MIRFVACMMLFALSVLAPPAQAETNNCTNITSLPAVLTNQGVYCLKQDLSTAISSGAAITINTNNVTIDCNDWKLGGLAAGAGTLADGIFASNRKNITIRNCGIRGFRRGINLDGLDSAYHLIEDNRVDLSTQRGIYAYGATIRRNRVYDSGGVTEAHGITSVGTAVVEDNIVQGVTSTSTAVGIFLNSLTDASFASRNRVSGLSAQTNTLYGFYTRNKVSLVGDTVINTATPAGGNHGIYCESSSTISVARDSVLIGFGVPASPVTNCTSAGITVP